MSVRLPTATLALVALGMAGCGPSASRADTPTPLSPPACQDDSATPVASAPRASTPLPDGMVVPISNLLELARLASPNRELFEANRAAAEAAISQARAWSNPEFEVNAGRAKDRYENDKGQRPTTLIGGIGIKQRFEMPGKRAARIAAAEARRSVATHETTLGRLELEVEIRSAALAVTSADARVLQAQRGADLSAQVCAAVEHRVQAGETDRGDLARARAEVATARLEVNAAQSEAEAARTAMRMWCGDRLPPRFTVSDQLPEHPPVVALAEVRRQVLETHPRLAVYAARQTAQVAAITAEERAWYPDLTLGASSSRETDTNDLGISVGIELPLWNRNEAGIAQARAELARSQAERRAEWLRLQREVAAAWSSYDRERQQITGLATSVVPAAQQARHYKMAAFQAGDASLLDVIEAQRAALNAEMALADARERAAQAFLALTAIVGGDPAAWRSASATPSMTPAGALP